MRAWTRGPSAILVSTCILIVRSAQMHRARHTTHIHANTPHMSCTCTCTCTCSCTCVCYGIGPYSTHMHMHMHMHMHTPTQRTRSHAHAHAHQAQSGLRLKLRQKCTLIFPKDLARPEPSEVIGTMPLRRARPCRVQCPCRCRKPRHARRMQLRAPLRCAAKECLLVMLNWQSSHTKRSS